MPPQRDGRDADREVGDVRGCEPRLVPDGHASAAAEDAAKFVFVRPHGYAVTRSVEDVGGKCVLRADIAKSGLLLLVR